MPRKISKIISHAKNRLSGKKSSSSSTASSTGGGGSTPSGRPSKSDHHHHRSSTGSTSDSSRLLQCYDDDDDRASGIGLLDDEMGQSQASTALAADYDDFESPDLNLQSLDSGRQQQPPKGSERAGVGGGSGPKPQSDVHQPTESLQGQPGRILRSLLSFGRTTGTTAVPTQPGYNELYAAEQVKDPNQKHWWQSDFLLGSNTINQQGPVLFGTWNGVFITTVVHLFGVISFLRIGWMVGLEGWPISMAIVFGCLLFNTISLLAAIGIMERCAASTTTGYGPFSNCCPAAASSSSGGGGAVINNRFDPEYPKTVAQARANVHILIATVLGSRIGGAISLVYCIGQAVSCALHVTGFTETFVHLCAVWIERQLSTTSVDTSESLYTNNSKNDTTVWIHSGTISTTEKSSSIAIMMARLMHIEIVHPAVTQANQVSDHNPSRLQLILTPETFQLTSMVLILLLFIFNIIGVRWLFRLQTILFLALVAAIADFTAGLFQQHPDFGYGPIRASSEYFAENSHPFMPAQVNGSTTTTTTTTQRWSLWHQLFDVVGVFFPATIGVMAGVNMGSDLQTPTKSIPCGSFMAIMSSYAVHVLFILGLALTCSRMALLNDYAIAQHVSAVGVFFLFGLYMSTISSSLGSMYTAPRIMQNLAQELHSVPVVRCFAKGRGPNNIPINALILFTLVTMGFVMIGGINTLAPIVTIPYLLTYAAIEYAYFSMAMTFDIQIQREKRFMQIASQLKQSDSTQSADLIPGHQHDDDDDDDQDQEDHNARRAALMEHRQASASKSINSGKFPPPDDAVSLSMSLSGATQNAHGVTPMSPSPSLQQQHLAGYGSIQSITQHIKIKRRQSTQSSDSDGEGGDHNLTGMANSKLQKPIKTVQAGSEQHSNKTRTASTGSSGGDGGGLRTTAHKTAHKKTIRQLMAAVSNSDDDDEDDGDGDDFGDDDQTTTNKDNKDDAAFLDDSVAQEVGDDEINQRPEIINENQRMVTHDLDDDDVDHQNPLEQSERLLMPDPELAEIACKQEVWYLRMMNRWIVLIASILKLLLMFFIAWHYAMVTISMYLLFCLIIGHFNPGFYPGVSEFSLCKWLRNTWIRLVRFCRPGNGYTNVGSGSGLINSNTQTNLMVASYSYDRIVMPESVQPDFQCQPDQLTKENADYKDRPPCHFTTNIEPQLN